MTVVGYFLATLTMTEYLLFDGSATLTMTVVGYFLATLTMTKTNVTLSVAEG